MIGDANGAVTTLATACEKFGKLYGETAKECGEAYFYYGKALLEMARMEAGVIDNVLDGGNYIFPLISDVSCNLELSRFLIL